MCILYLIIADINEVKRDVLNLEAKLASFKSYLQKEMATLKIRFSEIQCELKGKRFKEHKNYKPHEKNTKQFTEIVPSPVRVLINSPFKCPAKHELQSNRLSMLSGTAKSLIKKQADDKGT
ncbi:unnamed protein product [Parnassius apollo]|uniref:(apollo) hypothetical protein n=1 Tax=Parnassius apollo TaxID=110799 RepID=A0A8S3XZN6_PARAO|nr:unnamed protein product [Parnassius apollo]